MSTGPNLHQGDNGINEDIFDRYVRVLGGKRVIRKILIANNGIAAVKAIRSIRRWCYETFGNEHAVEFVAMATPEDVTANAEYVRMADIWTQVPGGSNNYNFANVDLIADVADRYSCDAVWAGWGHASENPALPRKLKEMSISFMGPGAESMHALGDKIASTIIAQSANVPTVSWSGQGLTVNYKATGCVPQDVYKRACVESAEEALSVAETCGYPVVIKASEGGGGKGIRVVFEKNALQPAYRHVAAEIPGSPIFVMKLVKNARHLEVQIVADESGEAVALHGRDCSVQRRHQKIIEEGPVVAAPPHIWKRLEQAAVALAKEVGYVGAGTVEYLYTGDQNDGEFYFLELNPRLQVEHPVTEWISGVNLPALQLNIAMGIPLMNVASIRKFFGISHQLFNDQDCTADGTCSSTATDSTLDSNAVNALISDKSQRPRTTANDTADLEVLDDNRRLINREPVSPHGHVIACRVTAENPDEGFQPTSGAIQELMFRNTPSVWGYFSVGASGGVHEYADSQFGHLFAWGETRESSRRSLVLALKELSIRGDIRTTVEYLIKLLEMDDFRSNRINTAWLDSLIAEKVTAERPPTELAVVVGAVCRAQTDFNAKADAFTKCLERGQLPALDRSLVEFPVELICNDVKYALFVTRADVSSFRVRLLDGDPNMGHNVLADVRTLADGALLVLVGGRSHVCYVRDEPGGMRLSVDGKTCLFPKEYDPATLTATVSGKLVRYLVEDGDHVEQNQAYAELEVMKMYLTLPAPEPGIITLKKPAGSTVEIGDVVAKLQLDDPSKVRKSEKFHGNLPSFGPPQADGSKPHQVFACALKNVELLLRGFDANRSSLKTLMDLIDDPRVAAGEFQDAVSALAGRIPVAVWNEVNDAISFIWENCSRSELQSTLKASADDSSTVTKHDQSESPLEGNDCQALSQLSCITHVAAAASRIKNCVHDVPQASSILSLAVKYEDGTILSKTATSLLDLYLEVERPFARSSSSPADVLFDMRDSNKGDLASLVEVAASHVQVKFKNEMVVRLLQELSTPYVARRLNDDSPRAAEIRTRLHQLSQLFSPIYSDIALRARIMLADFSRPQFRHRHDRVSQMLSEVVAAPDPDRPGKLQKLIGLNDSVLDVLVTFVLPLDALEVSSSMRKLAAEAQILRSYRAYDVSQLVVVMDESEQATLMATWRFRFPARHEGIRTKAAEAVTYSPPGMMKETSFLGLGNASSPPAMISFDSADNLSRGQSDLSNISEKSTYRHGILAVFTSVSHLLNQFDSVFERCTLQIDHAHGLDINVLTVLLRWEGPASSSESSSLSEQKVSPSSIEDPVAFEKHVSAYLSDFCRARPSRRLLAVKAGIKSITFIVASASSASSVSYPGFYTFRVQDNFEEDPIYRHIDPPMAYQLELARLSNFEITRFGYPNRSLHVFFSQGKAAQNTNSGGRSSDGGKILPQDSKSFTNLHDGQDLAPETTPSQEKPAHLRATSMHDDAESGLANSNSSIHSAIKPVPSSDHRDVKNNSTKRRDAFAIGNAVDDNPRRNIGRGASAFRSSMPPEKDVDARFFVRAVIRHVDVFSSTDDAVVSIPEAERTFVEALDAIEMASCDRRFRRTDCNHIFINVIPIVRIDVEDIEKICRRLFLRYASRCWLLRVFVVEIKVCTFSREGATSAAFLPLRFLLFNPTGHVLRVESYLESTDPGTGTVRLMTLPPGEQGSLHGSWVLQPYPIMDRMQRKRVVAKTIETVYVYDFIQLFMKQLQSRWRLYSEDRLLGGFRRHKAPVTPVKAVELVLADEVESSGTPRLVPTERPPGQNGIGMVAWRCTLFTPECPNGRDIILIANDITFRSGSFGPQEDALFVAASRLAREEGIPRIYLAANSGARIGIAEEVREKIQVLWCDKDDPTKGYECLAVSENDIPELRHSIVTGRKVSGDLVEVTDIIGSADDLGVENLMGSGLIAGETSAAYDDIFTLTYVTARTVGIGAYLVRLGQRVIQKECAAPIILTGFSALNKVLGHDVYVSNEQLGGTKIMHPNGITHAVVPDDAQGIGAVLDWLSFVPPSRGQPLPVIDSRDPFSRDILSKPPPSGQSYDPRTCIISGELGGDRGDVFLGGFFDRHSWRECLEGWAKSVVAGRARLGGVPTGVIAVETRTVERISPADPASPETHESKLCQAGQVWYPDSAAKTAQAIKDFDREGLPLFIFANWRGFSGGMRDMYDEVLKFGSLIVDALRCYRQPVFVYIPPGGELRGGAWVVLETLINPEQIEMYADSNARGGVLEPEGTVDVKYRRRDLLRTMHRLDSALCRLDRELQSGVSSSGLLLSDENRRALQDAIYAREALIMPVYKSIATSFCDLHDTPGRCLAKGAIRKILDWKSARSFFYWRLQRRLAENRVRAMCRRANANLSSSQITSLLRRWTTADYGLDAENHIEGASDVGALQESRRASAVDGLSEISRTRTPEISLFEENDRWVYQWLVEEEESIARRVAKLRVSRVAEEVEELASESVDGFLEGIEKALQNCSDASERSKLVSAIQSRLQQSSAQGSTLNSRSILPPNLLSRLRVGWDPLSR